jgi:hypothetical protein
MKALRTTSIYFLCIFAFLLFRAFLDEKLFAWIATDIFSTDIPSWSLDTAFGTLILLFLVDTIIRLRKRFAPSDNLTLILAITALIYILFYRGKDIKTSEVTWTTLSTKIFESVYYLDGLLIIFTGYLILWVRYHIRLKKLDFTKLFRSFQLKSLSWIEDVARKRKEQIEDSISDHAETELGLFCDEPIGKSGEDKLGYGNYARKLVSRVLSTRSQQSFAIGINAKWGSGKTSFFDLIKRELSKVDHIPMNFQPWDARDAQAISLEFFNELTIELGEYNQDLKQSLSRYSKQLNEFQDSWPVRVLNFLTNQSSTSNRALFERVKKQIEKIGKPLIVYIDDVDRLQAQEVLEVIKIIRNTANFGNTFFIVAYDREYVLNAIHEINSHASRTYLEKIFQVELTLPLLKEDILKEQFLEGLNSMLPETAKEEVEKFKKNTSIHSAVFSQVTTKRDINRLLNALMLNYLPIFEQVEVSDYVAVEVMRTKFPRIYNILAYHPDRFLIVKKDERTGMNYLQLKTGKVEDDTMDTLKAMGSPKKEELEDLPTLLYNSEVFPNMTLLSRVHCIELLRALFFIIPSTSGIIYESKVKSILIPSNYQIYFRHELDESDFHYGEFARSRKEGYVELEKFYDKCISSWKDNILINRVRLIKFYDGKEDFENIIKAQFYLARCYTRLRRYHMLDPYKDFLDYMDFSEGTKAKEYHKNRKELNEIFKAEFIKGHIPYLIESEVIKAFVGRQLPNPVISQIELEEIHIGYFRNTVSQSRSLHKELIRLYKTFKYERYRSTGNIGPGFIDREPNSAVKEICANFLLQEESFTVNLEILLLKSEDGDSFKFDPWLEEIFGSFDQFAAACWSKTELKHFRLTQEERIHEGEKIPSPRLEWFEEFRRFFSQWETGGFSWTRFVFQKVRLREIPETNYLDETE